MDGLLHMRFPMVLDETPDELKKRCRYAVQHNFDFAKGEEYVEALGGGEPPNGVDKFSAAHVLHLLEGGAAPAKAHKAAPAAKVEATPAATPAKKAAPKKAVEAKAEAKVEAKLSEKKIEDEGDRPTTPVDIRALHAAAQATKESWEVVLLSAGENPIGLVRALREVLGNDLREIELLISSPPEVLKTGLSQADAEAMQKQIEAAGAKIEVRKS